MRGNIAHYCRVERLLFAAQAEPSTRDYALLLTALRTGLRKGELAGLKWVDVHFGLSADDPDRYILVQRNYDQRWSQKMLTPKSRKSRRVDMIRDLRRALLDLRDERLVKAFAVGKADISREYVFPSEAETPLVMDNCTQRVFKPLLTKAGLRTIRFHDLRHTFRKPAPSNGRVAYVRNQLGHSSIQITVDIYGL